MEPTKAYVFPSELYYYKVRDCLIWAGFGSYESDHRIGLGFHKCGRYLDAGDVIFNSGKAIVLPSREPDGAGEELERLLSMV